MQYKRKFKINVKSLSEFLSLGKTWNSWHMKYIKETLKWTNLFTGNMRFLTYRATRSCKDLKSCVISQDFCLMKFIGIYYVEKDRKKERNRI